MGTVGIQWEGIRHEVPLVAARSGWLLGVPGQRIVGALAPVAPSGSGTGARSTGVVRFTLGTQTRTVPVRLLHSVPDPGWWWKLFHN